MRFGFDGKDYISLEPNRMRWVATNPIAVKTKEKWDLDQSWNNYWENYLQEVYVQHLNKYLQAGKEYFGRKGIDFSFDPMFWSNFTDLSNRSPIPFSVCLLFVFSPFPITVQPEVFISRSEPNSQYKPLTLSCLVTGFYPVDIEVNWLRNGEVMSETLSSGIRPNHDGTHQIQKEIEINAGDEDQYSCQIEHSSLAEPKVQQWGKELYWIWSVWEGEREESANVAERGE